MNTTPPLPQENKPAGLLRKRSFQVGLLLAAIFVAAVVAVSAYAVMAGDDAARQGLLTAAATRGPLVISVSESGTIQNRQRAIVKSEVEGTATILTLIPEGADVKKGDLLVELDSSRLQDSLSVQQITVLNAEAAFIRARENLAVTQSQTDSDIAAAELKYKFARQDLTKYTEGEHPRELEKAEADINIAKEELQRSTDKLDWSKRLAEEGYITRTELQADELAAKRAQIDLNLANSALDLLKRYTHQRSLDQLTSDAQQAKDALERTKRKGAADLVQAAADLKAKDSEFQRQKTAMEKISDQIAKCRITAPVGGMVVYSTTGQTSRFGNLEPLQEGLQVRERQNLIYLPTDAAMMIETKVHEASLQKVRTGMPVRVTADALPGRIYWGRVSKIGLLPDGQSARMNPDLKLYSTEIIIDENAEGLRAGMTCQAEIIVAQYDDALYVPVQSVVRVGGQTVVYVLNDGEPQTRPVEVGLDNNRMVHVVSGLADGEQVLLAPPLPPSAVREDSGLKTVPDSIKVTPAAGLTPATSPADATSRPAFDPARLRDMTPEERQKLFESLTPEQREAMRQRRGGRGERPGGTGAPGGTGEGPAGGERAPRPARPSGTDENRGTRAPSRQESP